MDVLIVEDHDETSDIIERNLRAILPGIFSVQNIAIDKVRSKGEVKQKLDHKSYKLAVLDLNLPEHQGDAPKPETGDSVSRMLSRHDIPTLMVTSSELSEVHNNKALKVIQRTQRQLHKRDLSNFEAFRVSLLETLYQQDKDEKISSIIEHTNDVAKATMLFELRGGQSFRDFSRSCQTDLKGFAKNIVKRSARMRFGLLDWRDVLSGKTFAHASDAKFYAGKDVADLRKYLYRFSDQDTVFSKERVHSDLGFLSGIHVKPVCVLLELDILLSLYETDLKPNVFATSFNKQIASLKATAEQTLLELNMVSLNALFELIGAQYA